MYHRNLSRLVAGLILTCTLAAHALDAPDGGWRARIAAARAARVSEASPTPADSSERDIILHVPATLPPMGSRALVVALHGGGNASFMQSHLKMDAVADQYGFIVAYLNGTAAGAHTPSGMHAWNAGDCCALPVENKIDDVGYITRTVANLVAHYGVEPSQVYVTGHSNGSIMAQEMLCQTDVFTMGVTLSGPLSSSITRCPAARGKTILALHGAQDENVPVAGGQGSQGPMKAQQVSFRAEASAQAQFMQSGASYTIQIIPDTDHALAHLDEAIEKNEGMSLAEKEARFFGLAMMR